jgi:hypothetical protein
MDPAGSFPCLQESAIGPRPDSHKFSSHPRPITLRFILILSTHLRPCLSSRLYPSGFLSEQWMHLYVSHSYCMTCLFLPTWHDHSMSIWRGIQVTKLFIMLFLSALPYSICLRPKYPLCTLFPSPLGLCSSLNGENVLQPCRVAVSILNKQTPTTDKRWSSSWMGGQQHLNLKSNLLRMRLAAYNKYLYKEYVYMSD